MDEAEKEKKEAEKKENDNEEKPEEEKEEKPKRLVDSIKESYTKTQLYGQDRSRFGFIVNLFNTIKGLIYLICGFLPYIWDVSAIILAVYIIYIY